MHGSYDPFLVGLSLVVSMLASYTTLGLAARICLIKIAGRRRNGWLLCGAFAMGAGIWSMHFIGMLAFKMPMEMGFDPWITGVSLLIAISVAYFALYVTTQSELSVKRLAVGGILMGMGMASMHYTGMQAMRMHPGIHYRPELFLLSIAIAVVASWIALWITFRLHQDSQRFAVWKKLGGGLVMGAAIAGMHYVGMDAAVFAKGAVCQAAGGISTNLLVIVISVFSMCGLTMTLILSMVDTKLDQAIFSSGITMEEANRQLRHLATIDVLTGIPNRSYFMERMEQRIVQAQTDGSPFTIMFMDLDGFKTINDSLGHAAGDELLKIFAKELKQSVRAEDMVARLGGDEFVLLLDSLGQPKDVAPIASSIIQRMQKDFFIDQMALRITASVGIATYPQDGDSVSSLLKNADMAMYDAKQHGKNSYRFFNVAMSAAATRILHIYRGLSEALEQNQFTLAFQPKFSNLQVVGAEALIRWHHPELGNVPPMDFIPIAEQTGQIVQISEWVIREVCRQLKVWKRAGLPAVKIAINLSPEQLRLENYVEQVLAMIEPFGVEPRQIMFEVTETVAMREPEMAGEMIRQFQRAGFDIAIDDFGTGYSSMAYLQQFRVKELKIDRFFTGALDSGDEEGQTIVSAIIALAHSLHMNVVAEGVETASQLRKLNTMKCDEVQGYLLARPLGSRDFESFLRDHSQDFGGLREEKLREKDAKGIHRVVA